MVYRLDNGLRLVALAAPVDYGVEHFGILFDVGSRDDPAGMQGLAHFVEHTIFKGTLRRRARHIRERMELVGGDLNAYTTKEETAVYSTFPAGNLARAAELIADLVTGSVFPEKELDLERQVVEDEIDSYLDIPSDGIFDDFEEHFFTDEALAHNILGNAASLRRLTSDACRAFLRSAYTAPSAVAYYCGALPPDKVCAVVSRYFAAMERVTSRAPRRRPAYVEAMDITANAGPGCADHHQAHTLLGIPVADMLSHKRFAVNLFANIIGGPGMNALLNVELRERRGLVYSVDSSTQLMSDNGLLYVYFGADREDTARCRRLVRGLMERIADKGLPARTLERCKRQYIGQQSVARANREQVALMSARSILYRGTLVSDDEAADAIRAVTAADLQALAARLAAPWCYTIR